MHVDLHLTLRVVVTLLNDRRIVSPNAHRFHHIHEILVEVQRLRQGDKLVRAKLHGINLRLHARQVDIPRPILAWSDATNTHLQMTINGILLDPSPSVIIKEVSSDAEWEGDPQEGLVVLGMNLLRVHATRSRFWIRRMCQLTSPP